MVFLVTDGPYRDLGSGFARLSGAEAPRRAPSSISTVEDALLELLRNARDAGASRIFVASALRSRRYRSLAVIDDGRGVPEAYADLIFEPGVTTRHLDPRPDSNNAKSAEPPPRGAGLALHHIKRAAVEARLARPASPTSVRAVFDTRSVPERSLQSETRSSKSNLLATTAAFARRNPDVDVFYAAPARILASLLNNHIIRKRERGGASAFAESLGLELSSKTVGRVVRGEVEESGRVGAAPPRPRTLPAGGAAGGSGVPGGPSLHIGGDAREELARVLRREAGASYMEVFDIKFETRPGEVRITARVHEPEDEYE